MWRIWNNFPKVFRQQLHGSRASAGGVCVDEEKQEHNAELAHASFCKAELGTTPCIVRSANDHLSLQAIEGGGAELVQKHFHKPRCRGKLWFKLGAFRQHTSENNAEVPIVCSEKKDLETPPGLVAHAARESHGASETNEATGGRGESLQHQCPGKIFWSKVSNFHQRTLDVVSWGATVVLGFHLSWQPTKGNHFPIAKGADLCQPWRGLVFRLALAMPPDSFLGTERSILDQQKHVASEEESLKKTDEIASSVPPSANLLEDGKTLADAIDEFMQSCKKYAAVGSTVSGVLDVDAGRLTRAVEQLEQASQLGHPPAYYNLALCYEMGSGVQKDVTKAAGFYRKAAAMGHAQSLFNLALMTLEGEGGLRRDKPGGIAMMNQAADKGIVKAQLYLGLYYTENDDNQQDFAQAASFFSAAAGQDDADAQYFLGICYENGWGVNSSDEEAGKLYAAAAQAGHAAATYNLAAFYEHGLGGFEHDAALAMSLYEKAAAQGDDNAILRLQEEKARLAVSQWEESQHDDTPGGLSDQVPDSPCSLRRTACSSPSLSDHIRHSFSTFWEESLQSWISWQSSAARHHSVSSPWDQQDTSLQEEPYGFQINRSCTTDMHRSSTMPNLSVVPVQ